jgi:hypothetical protein
MTLIVQVRILEMVNFNSIVVDHSPQQPMVNSSSQGTAIDTRREERMTKRFLKHFFRVFLTFSAQN